MLRDWLAEGASLLRVTQRVTQRTGCDTGATSCHVDTAEFEAAHGLLETTTLDSADQLLGRDTIVFEDEFSAVDRLVAELANFLGGFEAVALFADEHAHALMARLRLGVGFDEHTEAGTVDPVGDPGLRAVDDVVITITTRDGANALQIGACIGLGETNAAADFSARKLGQPTSLLFVRAMSLHAGGHDEVGIKDADRSHPDRGDAHYDARVGRG